MENEKNFVLELTALVSLFQKQTPPQPLSSHPHTPSYLSPADNMLLHKPSPKSSAKLQIQIPISPGALRVNSFPTELVSFPQTPVLRDAPPSL